MSSNRRTIGHWDGSDDARAFAESRWAEDLCRLGTSCPDHFLRTRICPMFVPWNPGDGLDALVSLIDERIGHYRVDYAVYYRTFATSSSPALRDSNPSVVIIPGLGIFGFARDKREARITTEFYRNAINVMSGANALEGDGEPGPVPQAKRPEHGSGFLEFPQLRRPSALRGVPNRVLGARGSQASAHAAGEGVQPEDRTGHRGQQRHRSRDRSRAREAWCPRCRRRPQPGRRDGSGGGSRDAFIGRGWCSRRRSTSARARA